MVLFHNFCLVFSLRLGGILIGGFNLIKALIFVICYYRFLENIDYHSQRLDEHYSSIKTFKELFTAIHLTDGLLYYVIALITFFVILSLFSIILILGAYQCKRNFIYPFLVFYLLDILLVILQMGCVFLYIYYAHPQSLGMVILYFNVGFFILVFYVYTWICIYSLIKVIDILENRLKRQRRRLQMESAMRVKQLKR